MKTADYSFYLFVQLRMLYAPSELPYDIMYGEDLQEFENYLESEFNKDTEPEYECMEAYLKHKFKPHRETRYKFARKCDIRGEGMNAGYCIGDGDMYIKYEGDMLNHLYKQEGYDRSWTDDETLEYFFDQGYYYYTDWEADEDEWYEADNEDGINPKLVEAEF